MPTVSAPSSRTVRRQPKRGVGLGRWLWRGVKLALLASVVGAGFMGWKSGRLEVALD